jgi:hypothetical protein|tara:strand:+ start:1537 stop:1806 length:270 start_codon:yes stop_codon:yes gene_type:complete
MVKPKRISKEDWDDLMEEFEGALMATGFEEALIGFGYQFNKTLAVYDRTKCLNILMSTGMDYEEAVEYFEFNVVGSYVGETTPVFISLI